MATRRKSDKTKEVHEETGEFEDEMHHADLSQCVHRVRDDDDCGTCRANGCGGGADCDCGGAHSRRNPMPFGTAFVHDLSD
jgi:hypothetical protein